jgi:probable rRNA maturation factor
MPVSVTTPRGLSRLAPPLRTLVLRVLRRQGRRAGEIGVVLADDAMLRRLNREWRGLDRATDVLSFAYDERELDAAQRPVRGDLLVSLDRVAVQARRYRVSRGEELARLVVHGALHLCGHDHVRTGERERMRAEEDAALRLSGDEARVAERVLAGAVPAALTPRRSHRPARRSRALSSRRRRAHA